MEKNLLKLIKVAIDYEKTSKKNYIEICYLGQNTIEINIRKKKTFDYIQTTEIKLNKNIFTIDDVIAKIEKLKEEEK